MSFQKKLVISFTDAVFFFLVNLPETYKFVDSLIPNVKLYDHSKNCPTLYGQLLHTLVFSLINFVQMNISDYMYEEKKLSLGLKIKYTIYGGLLFFLLSSPVVYKLVGQLTNGIVADNNGCPSYTGVVVHSVVYGLALLSLMYLPDNKENVDDDDIIEQSIKNILE